MVMNKQMKKYVYIFIGIAIAGLLIWPKINKQDTQQASTGAPKKGMPIKVVTQKVQLQKASKQVEVTGNIMANEEVILYPEVAGKVVHIYFNEGASVKQNDLLVKINDIELQAQLRKAISTQKLKQQNEQRAKQLLDKGGISNEAYDIALNEWLSIQADVDLLKEQIRKTEIRAPFNGKIGLRNVSVGSYVNPSTRIAALQNMNPIKIEFAVPEKHAAFIQTGNTIQFETVAKKQFQARIYAIEPKVDEATRNVVMRALTNNDNGALLPGTFVKINLQLQQQKESFQIPTQAVVPILKGQKVFVVQGDSVIERKIKVTDRNDVSITVEEGLNNGDEVVVEGVMYLREGSKVQVVNKK